MADVFSIRCAALTVRVFHDNARVRSSCETVLFSFEGSDPHVPLPDLVIDAGTGDAERVTPRSLKTA